MSKKHLLFILSLLYSVATFSATVNNEQEINADIVINDVKEQKHQAEKYFNKKDFKNGIISFEKAAEQGDAESQMMLGYIYYTGLPGVESHFVKAKLWIEKACKQEYKDSCSIYQGMKLEKPCRLVDTQVWICN